MLDINHRRHDQNSSSQIHFFINILDLKEIYSEINNRKSEWECEVHGEHRESSNLLPRCYLLVNWWACFCLYYAGILCVWNSQPFLRIFSPPPPPPPPPLTISQPHLYYIWLPNPTQPWLLLSHAYKPNNLISSVQSKFSLFCPFSSLISPLLPHNFLIKLNPSLLLSLYLPITSHTLISTILNPLGIFRLFCDIHVRWASCFWSSSN